MLIMFRRPPSRLTERPVSRPAALFAAKLSSVRTPPARTIAPLPAVARMVFRAPAEPLTVTVPRSTIRLPVKVFVAVRFSA